MAAFDEGLSYPALHKTDSQKLQCTHHWPCEANDTPVAMRYKMVSRQREQGGQDTAGSTVYTHVVTNDLGTTFYSAPYIRACLIKNPFQSYEYTDSNLPKILGTSLQ